MTASANIPHAADDGGILSSLTDIQHLVTDRRVVVHPIVLLSVVDHYNRVAKGTNKRVVGTLLGECIGNDVHVCTSFAVPFEEDSRDPTVWYFDHNYHELLFRMFKKVNAKERVVGWYSTGPKIKPADLEIHQLYRRYAPQPLYVIVDINPQDMVVPTSAYFAQEEPTTEKLFRQTFVHIPSTIGAFEAEEVGVEHLLRDLKNASTSTLATQVGDKLNGLKNLCNKLTDICMYLDDIINDRLPPNPRIIYNLQDIFNLLPDIDNEELVKSFSLASNDMMLALYLGTVVRSVMALHNLINNKVENRRNAEQKSKESSDKRTEKKNEETNKSKSAEKNENSGKNEKNEKKENSKTND